LLPPPPSSPLFPYTTLFRSAERRGPLQRVERVWLRRPFRHAVPAAHWGGGRRPLKNPWFWKEPRFLRPSDARNAHEKCCGIRLWGAERKRVPCGHLGRRPKATRSAPEGSVSPVGCCAKRKATRRCEQIQGLRAASAQNADICEGSETMSATVREARMIEQPMIPLHP